MKTQQQLSIPQAAHLLRASYNTVYCLVLRGELDGEQRDGRWFIRTADVQRLLRSRESTADNAAA